MDLSNINQSTKYVENNINNNANNANTKIENYCSNCGYSGHLFKDCCEPVNSYGLLCFYKKTSMVKDTIPELTNRRTKTKKNEKNDYSLKNNKNYKNKSNNSIYSNLNKIQILKRHETISHTLKNMIGIVGNINPCEKSNVVSDIIDDTNAVLDEIDGVDGVGNIDSVDGVIDIEEIIDMDDEYQINTNTNTNTNTNANMNIYTHTSSLTQSLTPSLTQTNNINNIIIEKEKEKMKEITIQKVILVQRRNTIGLIEFIRGKYKVDNPNYIIKLFNMMTFDEKRIFREYDSFDMLRTIIGLKKEFNYRGEYSDAKNKFNTLRDDPRGNQIHALLDKSYTKWSSPEWGLPKGRRSNKEYDIECAIREFVEETGVKYKNINVYRNIKPLEEIYKGVNGVIYKHTYFIADIKDTIESKENITYIEKGGFLNSEVSNVKCFTLTECQKIIRPYYLSKLNVIKKGFQIIHCMNSYFE
jgi:hypothetical protein